MFFFTETSALQNYLARIREEKKKIGLVPTMGALHEGHVSLINRAKQSTDIVVCSIFVNPTQFNNLLDLEKYPRTLEADKKMLEQAQCNVLFAPEIAEIYSSQELTLKAQGVEDKSWAQEKNINFESLDKVMEGAQRPGHFNGVAQVVSKLFRIVNPDQAFFGQKDFQQLAIIRSMVKQLDMGIEIISCPIKREIDGLAMSSRNTRLTPQQRKIVPVISQTLYKVKALSTAKTPEELKNVVMEQFRLYPQMRLSYFEIADAETLLPVLDFKKHSHAVACIAVELGNLRLIDNMILY